MHYSDLITCRGVLWYNIKPKTLLWFYDIVTPAHTLE